VQLEIATQHIVIAQLFLEIAPRHILIAPQFLVIAPRHLVIVRRHLVIAPLHLESVPQHEGIVLQKQDILPQKKGNVPLNGQKIQSFKTLHPCFLPMKDNSCKKMAFYHTMLPFQTSKHPDFFFLPHWFCCWLLIFTLFHSPS